MAKKSYHVVPAPDGGWDVRKKGAARASRHFDGKGAAVKWGWEISRIKQAEFYVHRRDGTIRGSAKAKKSYHVVPAPDGGWDVRKKGAVRASRHFDGKGAAVKWGWEISRIKQAEFYVHRRDGTIRGSAKAKKSYHVVSAPDGGWDVRKKGAVRASKHFDGKGAAVKWGREISKSKQAEFYVHRRDGTIQQKDSHGRN